MQQNICLALGATSNLIFRGDIESDIISNDDNLKFMNKQARDIMDYNNSPEKDDLRAEIDDRYVGTHVQQQHFNNIVEGIVSVKKTNFRWERIDRSSK